MQHKINKLLFDTKISINEFVIDKKDFSVYQNNKLVKRAVGKEIEIIGEAVNRILKIDSRFKLENNRKIVDTRNWVLHA